MRQLLSAEVSASFAALASTLPAGGTDQVRVLLSNSGTTRARGPVEVDLFASADGTLGVNATKLASVTRRINLKAGKTTALPLRFFSPATLPQGGYYLVGSVSGTGVATSTIVSSGPVTIIPPVIDLTAQIARLPGQPVEFGSRPRFSRMTVDVFNQGNVIARGSVVVTVYISVDGKFDATATPVNVSLPRSVRIKPGGVAAVTVSFAAPPGIAPGQYFLLAQVHAGGGIVETKQDNNLAISSGTVQVVAATDRHHRAGYYTAGEFDPVYYLDDGGDDYSGYYPPADTANDPRSDPSGAGSGDTGGVSVEPPYSDPIPDPTQTPTSEPTTEPSSPPDSSGDSSSDTTGSSNGSDF